MDNKNLKALKGTCEKDIQHFKKTVNVFVNFK